MIQATWRVRLTKTARRDIAKTLSDTRQMFGVPQEDVYRALIASAIQRLTRGPDVPGSISRERLWTGVRSLHLDRVGGRGSHMVVYRVEAGQVIEVLRLLHQRMDIARHVPKL